MAAASSSKPSKATGSKVPSFTARNPAAPAAFPDAGDLLAKSPTAKTRKKSHSGDVCASSAPALAGVLHKWVNYGKGWRPRWFELEDGILFYYKIHGPDKICVQNEQIKASKIIGDESRKLLKKPKFCSQGEERQHRRTFGEVHLKVCSLRESKSDDRKFYIYTGTKTLHLRAESKEDRTAWMDALRTSKDLFPKDMSSLSYPPPADNIKISTGALNEHLVKLGVPEQGIKECEKIMMSEFTKIQHQLRVMQQKRLFLIEKIRLLEADKLELETTVVDEMQNNASAGAGNVVGALKDHVLRLLGADESESDEDIRQEVVEAESDDEDFFDTRESLSEAYLESAVFNTTVELIENEDVSSNGPSGEDVVYPSVKRRTRLPEPKEVENCVSLWSMIRDNIGKDLSRICLPVYFNEPLSSLQKCFEDLEYSQLLDRAREYGQNGNRLMRILYVAAFAVSGYASTEGRHCKPFNPLLGETYEADFPDKGVRFIAEKVSHHPMVIACHCQGRGWELWGDSTLKSKFWGRSIQLDPVGVLTLQFDDGETFQWSKVTSSINNIILGKLYVDHYGTMRIQGNRGLSCKLKFKEQSMIDRNPHQVQGYVHNEGGDKLASLIGKWDESMYYVLGDPVSNARGYDPMDTATLLWQKNPPAEFPTRYNLTAFAITLNEITPDLKQEKLPPTDSRLRPDQRYLENGEYDLANAEKQRLEQKQRQVCLCCSQAASFKPSHPSQARKLQETGWTPRWFKRGSDQGTYRFVKTYWEARKLGQWQGCPDIFGPDLASD
ncbi:oxysterol-binding protein-related protein 1B isoform X1 [Selaginella moellendorffii]|uniref:oxysterol-binding protein-related protein 1B isoform X1 n=1 Tax=Selaginella moellendorffii TaxID=88036 RepID=UPI000D1C6813|nr:oxysterol-binding protein-related protein 1B isoform X1 [Selaginella moellendorffii]|eukprot:XP_024526825.1 oxysterol-binding protein-related protein 1B isoform X1 [Selaginella moellendorffii]